MITLSNQSRLQIPKFGKTVYTLWSEIEMMIKKVRRDRSSRQRCSIKKLLIKISQYSQENTYVGFVAGLISCNFIKKRLQHKCFPASIVKFLRIAFLWNTSGGCLSLGTFLIVIPISLHSVYTVLPNFEEHLRPAASVEKQRIVCIVFA